LFVKYLSIPSRYAATRLAGDIIICACTRCSTFWLKPGYLR